MATDEKTNELQFDGVIFDFDGTLVDTLEDLADSMNRVLGFHEFPVHSYDSYKHMIGRGIRQLVSEALPPERRVAQTISECFDEMIAEYQERCLVKTRLYEGVAELLSGLRRGGVRLAVFSNKADGLTRRIVAALIGSATFDVVIGARPDIPLKPDPAGALLISTRLDLAPDKIVFLGDSGTDMLTATAAGMIALGAAWGFRTDTELRESGARMVLGCPRELLALRTGSGR